MDNIFGICNYLSDERVTPIIEDGKVTGIKIGGADTVYPFSISGGLPKEIFSVGIKSGEDVAFAVTINPFYISAVNQYGTRTCLRWNYRSPNIYYIYALQPGIFWTTNNPSKKQYSTEELIATFNNRAGMVVAL